MKLHNAMTRRKEEFTPREPGRVSMYVCGITAYDLCHIGHARSAVVFDTLYRLLRHKGLDVTYIRNFTDIDDKIINRANETGSEPAELAERFIGEFYTDMDALNVLRPDEEPRCTAHIQEMIQLTEALVDKGHAYETLGGDVYFRVRSFEGYGKLSGRRIEDLRSGSRIEPGEEKEDPLDFALWKAAKPGEPWWESPWGKGRPGWHLECSAMSAKYVELPLDIHGGGQDLAFPHHENEIAQSEAATGKPLARYWVHNGFVRIDDEKMSKSLGNFFTIRDILEQFLPETLRYLLLTMHYRSPLEFSFDTLKEAEKAQKRVYQALAQLDELLGRAKWSKAPAPEDMAAELDGLERGFIEAMDDDLNTAQALGRLFSAVRLAGRIAEDKALKKAEGARELMQRIRDDLRAWGGLLGVFEAEPGAFLEALKAKRAEREGIDPEAVAALMDQRQAARKAKDFAEADRIRNELDAMGVEVMDTPQGPVWDVR